MTIKSQLFYLVQLSMESVIDYERADTLFVLRTDEKEANLKAGRTFLIVDGELSIPVTMYFTVTSSPSSSITPHH
jgi:outer membrane lipoprotein-sorting protein